MCALQSQLALLLQALSGIHPYRQIDAIVLSASEVLHIFEVSECPRQKVRRHDGRPVEADNLVSILALTGFFLMHVAQSH